MADYPVSLDTLVTDILGTDKQSTRNHAELHNNINDAVNELEKKVGIIGSSDTDSHDYKITQLESNQASLLWTQHSHSNIAALWNVRADLSGLHYLWGDGSYHITHTHSNKTVLDNITASGLSSNFLAEDGNYYPTHSHSNMSVLNNITNGWPANEFLAADWLYYTIGGTGASWHDIEYDTVWLPVRSILNFYGAGVHVYDNAGDDSLDIFIEWANQATGSAYIHHEIFDNNDWYIDHELNTTDVIVACYDINNHLIEFDSINFLDSNHAHLHFSWDVCGKAVFLTKWTSGSWGCCNDGLSGYSHSQIVASNSRAVNHNLETDDVIVMCYDTMWHHIEPDDVFLVDNNNLVVSFTDNVVGKAVVLCEMKEACESWCSTWWCTVQWNSTNVSTWVETLNFIGAGVANVSETAWVTSVNITWGGGWASDGVVDSATLVGNILTLGRTLALPDVTGDLSSLASIPANGTYNHIQWSASTTWNVNHNLNSHVLTFRAYDTSANWIEPDSVNIVDDDNIVVWFTSAVSWSFVVVAAGWAGGSDGNDYVDSAVFDNNSNELTLWRTWILSDLVVDLSSLSNTLTNGTYNHTPWSASTTWNVNHNLGSQVLTFRAYDASGNWIEPDSVNIVDDDNIIVWFTSAIDWTLAVIAAGWAGGSGEINTASNLWTGEWIFASKVWVDLQFKSLVAGSGVNLSSTATEVTVTAVATPVAWNIESNSGTPFDAAIGDFVIDNHVVTDTTINLPTAVGNDWLSIMVKKNNDGWHSTIVDWFGTEKINWYDQLVLSQDQSLVTLISDGAGWHIGS